ncbi:hypothetical protein SLOPH_506, partial [Spraguea lophii 42_110]
LQYINIKENKNIKEDKCLSIPTPSEVQDKIILLKSILVRIISDCLLEFLKRDKKIFEEVLSKDVIRYTNDNLWIRASKVLKGNEPLIRYVYDKNILVRLEINNKWCKYFDEKICKIIKDGIGNIEDLKNIVNELINGGSFLKEKDYRVYKSLLFDSISQKINPKELLVLKEMFKSFK